MRGGHVCEADRPERQPRVPRFAPPARRAAAGRRRPPSARRALSPPRPASPSAPVVRAGRTRASRTRRAAFRAWRAATAPRARRRRCRALRAATRPPPTSPPRASAPTPRRATSPPPAPRSRRRAPRGRTRTRTGRASARPAPAARTSTRKARRRASRARRAATALLARRRRCRARLAATRAPPTSPTRASAPTLRRATSPPRARPQQTACREGSFANGTRNGGVRAVPRGVLPGPARRRRLRPLRCWQVLPGGLVARAGRAVRGGHVREADRPERRPRVPRLPRRLVVRRRGGAALRVLAGLFRRHGRPLRVRQLCGRDVPGRLERDELPSVRGGQLLRRGRVGAAAVRCGQLLDRHQPSPPRASAPTPRPGHFATTGSTQQTACAKGSYTDAYGQGECTPCAGGTYQDEEGKTACEPCEAGSYCAVGAAAALPCEAGSYSSATNLTDASECTDATPGHFATTGSTRADGVPRGQLRQRHPQRRVRAVPRGVLPGPARRRRLRPLRCWQVLPGQGSSRELDAQCEVGTYARLTDQERRPRVPRLPRRLVVRRRGGAALRVLAGLFRRHGRPLRVRQLCGRDVPGRVERDGLPSVRGGQLLRRGRVGAAAVRCGQLLDRHQPHRRERVHRRLAGPLRHHRLHAADGVRQGVVHGRVRAGRVHALRRRHVPGRGRQGGVRAVRGGQLLLCWRGGGACRARLAATRAPPTSPTRASAPTLRRATSPPRAPPSRRRAARAASPTAPATTRASCAPRGTTRTSPPLPPASAALLASFALRAPRASWTRSARRARTRG